MKHLIVAVGGECYVTFPKGQLVPTQGAELRMNAGIPKVPGGGHVLIIPIAHFATLDAIPGELRAPVMRECHRYIPSKLTGERCLMDHLTPQISDSAACSVCQT